MSVLKNANKLGSQYAFPNVSKRRGVSSQSINIRRFALYGHKKVEVALHDLFLLQNYSVSTFYYTLKIPLKRDINYV